MRYAEFRFPISASAFLSLNERQKTTAAIVASILLHLLGFAFFALGIRFSPTPTIVPLLAAAPLEVKIVRTKTTPLPPPQVAKSLPFVSSNGLQKTTTKTDDAKFESDADSIAASEHEATGLAPLPSQEGRNLPFLNFQTQNFTLGSKPVENAAPTPVPQPMAQPVSRPEPETEQELAKPTPLPISTPKPIMKRATLALSNPTQKSKRSDAKKAASPRPLATPKPHLSLRPDQTVAMLTSSPPPIARPEAPGYRPQMEKTLIEGSISNRGKAAIDASASPLGIFRKAVADAIGSRWYYYVNQRMDLISVGDVYISFYVNDNGHVEDVKVLSNTSNEVFANFCVQSITEAEIPKLPGDITQNLENGRLEIRYHFLIYPN
jgi:outer membrane biosynthesis protein TonB